MSKLPVVTAETLASVLESIRDNKSVFSQTALKVFKRENPLLYNEVRKFVKRYDSNSIPSSALIAAVAVYSILSAQAAADEVKEFDF